MNQESDSPKYKYLDAINSPEDLRKLPPSALQDVCNDVREHLVDTITKIGGHFGGGLGVVELTVALHYVFNTPKDKIVLDTGHQGYPHKILTGRKDVLHTIRQKGGISGFLKRTESPYDDFGAGHASTSISAGLGMAVARDLRGEDYNVISVIGDGAMTGGLAYEAMNNIGVLKPKMIVILNDNNMSISENVWAISNYFTRFATKSAVKRVRDNLWELTGKMDDVGDRIRKVLHRVEDGVKAFLTPGMLFEALGFKYFGPINGHNIQQLVQTLEFVKDINDPVLLHVTTQKGYGYAPAQKDRQFLHAIGKVDKITGKAISNVAPPKPSPPAYQKVFGQALAEIMQKDKNVVGVTAAMPDGTSLDLVQKEFPKRIFDVGIAESHAVTFAAGLATQGIVPVVAIYSTFLQRAFDNIVHDCALQHLHVVFALDRGGLVGADGPTHHGVLDLAYLRIIQTMVVMAPKDEQELRDMLYTATCVYKGGPISIRYPRGNALGVEIREMKEIPIGKGEILAEGDDIAIIAIGKTVAEAMSARNLLQENDVHATIVNARFVKPIDTELIDDLCSRFSTIITVEDGQIEGGFGSAVAEYVTKQGYSTNLVFHGIPDIFVDHGTQEELYDELGLDAKGITKLALMHVNQNYTLK